MFDLFIIICHDNELSASRSMFTVVVFDRLTFTMLVLQKSVKMVHDLPEVMRVAYAFLFIMLCWMTLWSFGVSGIIASSMDDSITWWLLVVSWQVFSLWSICSLHAGSWLFSKLQITCSVHFFPLKLQIFSVSLFWTGAVLCNTVHVIVSGMVFLVLIHGDRSSTSMPPEPLLNSLRFAMTTSFGSICYGSLFTAAIRTMRWEVFLLF